MPSGNPYPPFSGFSTPQSASTAPSGWTRDAGPPATVRLTTSTDQVAIGTNTATIGRKLTVESTGANLGIRVESLATSDNAMDVHTAPEAQPRLSILADGAIRIGGGALVPDVRLRRTGAGMLQLDDGAGGPATFRAAVVISGDLAFDDECCINCRRPLGIGDRIVFQVHAVAREPDGKRYVKSVPVHVRCDRAQVKSRV